MTPLQIVAVLVPPLASFITFRTAVRFVRDESRANRSAFLEHTRQANDLATITARAVGEAVQCAMSPAPVPPPTPHDLAAVLVDETTDLWAIDDTDPTDATIFATRPDVATDGRGFGIPGLDSI